MNNTRISIISIVLLLTALISCENENEEELFGVNPCSPESATYSKTIEPIISANCAVPNCHDGSNQSIPDWTILENVQAQAALIKERTGNRTMPPSSSGLILLKEEIDDIACWVDNGAQNN